MVSSRKTAIQAYKKRKISRGVFAVRCLATGTVWVDHAMDLDAAEKRTSFVLPLGDRFLDQEIFAEFRAHGAESFRYEILEKFDEDLSPLALRDLLKQRKLHWLGQLNARSLSPA